MPGPASLLLATWVAFAPGSTPEGSARLAWDVEGLDAIALEQGLRARVGDALDQWSIEIERESPSQYRIELRHRGGRPDRRVVTLTGPTDEDRSRELAATLAVILDDPEVSDPRPARPPAGFVLVEADVQLGPPDALDPSVGLGLGGGAWVLDDHLQPRVRVGWSHSWAGELAIHQVDAGLGLAAGGSVGSFWFGGLVLPSVKWTYASQVRASSGWFGGGELSVVGQWRQPSARGIGVVVGLRTGIETTFPAPRVAGTQTVIRWGHVRWLTVLELGFGVGRSGFGSKNLAVGRGR